MKSKKIDYYDKHSLCDRKEEAIKIVEEDTATQKVEVIRACRQNNVVYLACKVTDKATNRYEVVCKIFDSSVITWKNEISYEVYSEEDVPERLWHCPSNILKKLSPNPNKNAKDFRQTSKDILEELAQEKLEASSLTNLPVGSQITLVKKDYAGNTIILEKVYDSTQKTPYWRDIKTNRKFKKIDIQKYGYLNE